MANAEMNEKNETDGKSFFSGEEDENALLAEDGNDHDTTGVQGYKLWEAIEGLQKKVDLLAGTSTCITDASLKRKVPQTAKAESKSDSNSQPGPSKKES